MITKAQQNQIFKYLSWVNLAEDMQMEVFDHMMYQIEDLMAEGMTFDKAFEKVKTIWKKDLDNVWFGFKRIPFIQKKRVVSIKNAIAIKSFLLSLSFAFLWIVVAKFLSIDFFAMGFKWFNYFMIGVPFALILGIAIFKYFNRIPFKKNLLTIEDLLSPMLIGLGSSFHLRLRYMDGVVFFNGIHQSDFSIILKYSLMNLIYYFFEIYFCIASMRIYKELKLYKLRLK